MVLIKGKRRWHITRSFRCLFNSRRTPLFFSGLALLGMIYTMVDVPSTYGPELAAKRMINTMFGVPSTYGPEPVAISKKRTMFDVPSTYGPELVAITKKRKPGESDMTVIILSMDRFESLQRLLTSLQLSEYGTDVVDLVVRFDRPSSPNFSYTQKWMQRLEKFRDSLSWDHGQVSISVANKTLGLAEAWFRAWNPSSDDDRAVIFEDDLEVSPVWYEWLKGAHDAYQQRADLAAFSLSHQELVPLKTSSKTTRVFPKNEPFMYALMGSHGFSPLARVWREFLEFVRCSQQRQGNTSIATPGLITSDWYHGKMDRKSMWTQHFIYFSMHHNLYNIYQFPNDRTLTAHWQEKGAHFDGSTKRQNYPLFQKGEIFMEFPAQLKKYDWGANLIPDAVGNASLPPVVMSAAVGYSLAQFEAFVGSLRKFYSGAVFLLISKDATPEVQAYLKENRVRVVETEAKTGLHNSRQWEQINRDRFKFFVSICDAKKYSVCLTTDFRDSLFQSDPFQSIMHGTIQQDVSGSSPFLYLHEHRIDMNDYHYELMKTKTCGLYKTFAKYLRGTQIINGGSIMGSPSAFQLLSYYITETWKGCNDQVTLNVVARTNKLQNITVRVFPQGQGIMNVVGWGGEVIRDSRGNFLNSNCLVSPVVHQYDIAVNEMTSPPTSLE